MFAHPNYCLAIHSNVVKLHYKTSFLNFDHGILVMLMCNKSCLENKRQKLFILGSRRKKK
jgi:hypothetical protein